MLMLVLLLLKLLVSSNPLTADELSSGIFCEIAEISGGTCVTLPKPEEGDDDPTVWCTALNIIMSTIQPTITGITPLKIPREGTANLLVTAPNANFNSSSQMRIEGSEVTINQTKVLSPTKIQVNVTVPHTAALQFYDVFVETQLGEETEAAQGVCALEIVEKPAGPQILSITPGKVEQGTFVETEIYGINTHFDASSVLDFGEGVTASIKEVISPTHLIATVDVAKTALIGFHPISVITGAEEAEDVQAGGALLVLSSLHEIPLIESLTPKQGRQGNTMTLTLNGAKTHFSSSSTLSFSGIDITVTSLAVKNTTQMSATIKIAADAALGFRDVFVSTGEETATGLNSFEIQPNHAPTEIGLSHARVMDSASNNTVVGIFTTADIDNESHIYTLEDNAGGRFKIVGNELQVANSNLLDKTNQASHQIQVKSTDNGGLTLVRMFTITVDSNAPSNLELSNDTLVEHSEVGHLIGTLSTRDPNPNDTHTYTLIDDADQRFKLEDDQLLVAKESLEVGDYSIKVRTTDNTGLSLEKQLTITVEAEKNQSPTEISLDNHILIVNSEVGTEIGQFSTMDPNSGDTHIYTLINDAEGRFKIVDDKLVTNQVLSTVDEYEIVVRSTDPELMSVDQNLTISIRDMTLSNHTVIAYSAVGTEIGTLSTTVAYRDESYTYSLKNHEGGRFKLEDNRLLVGNQELLEAGDYNLTIRSTDSHDSSFEKNFTITVTPPDSLPTPPSSNTDPSSSNTNTNHPPSGINLSAATTLAHSTSGTLIGVLSTTDSDSNDSHTYQLDNNAGGRFTLVGNQLQVANSALLTIGHYDIVIRSTDSTGLSVTNTFSIEVKEVEKTSSNSNDDNQNGASADLIPSQLQFANEVQVVNEYGTSSTLVPSIGSVVGHLITVPVIRTGSANGTVAVYYDIIEDNAIQNIDYIVIYPKNQPLTWLDGDTTAKLISLFIINDNQNEEDEMIRLRLTHPTDSAQLGTPSEMQLIIKDFNNDTDTKSQCQSDDPELFLQPTEQNLSLALGELPVTVTITGGQGKSKITQAPDGIVVTMTSLLFFEEGGAQFTLTPRQVGQTQLVLGDCASEAVINITVFAPEVEPTEQCSSESALALQPTEQAITLEMGETPITLTFTGGQEKRWLSQAPNGMIVTLELPVFPEEGGAQLKLTPRQVGDTQLAISDCASEAVVNIRVIETSPDITTEDTTVGCQTDWALALQPAEQNLPLKIGDDPLTLTFIGGQGEIEIIQPPDATLVTLEPLYFPKEGSVQLTLTPIKAGETQLILSDCAKSEAIVNITVVPASINSFGMIGIDAKNNSIETNAAFEGQLSRQADQIIIGINLSVDSAHLGKPGSLILVMFHPSSGRFFMHDDSRWQTWDGQFTQLVPIKNYPELPSSLIMTRTLALTSLPVDSLWGELLFYVGYHVEDEQDLYIFNGLKPLNLFIGNALGISPQGQVVNTSAYFEGYFSTDTGQDGNSLIIGQSEPVTANFTIQVDTAHQGHGASLILVAEQANQFFMYSDSTWQPWNGHLTELVAAEFYDHLPTHLTVTQPFNSETQWIDPLAGPLILYLGYRLGSGVIIYNGLTPLRLQIANGQGLSLITGDPVNTATQFETRLRTTSGLFGNDLTLTTTDPATLEFTIKVDKGDVGQAASLILLARQTSGNLVIHNGTRWQPWDDDLTRLQIARIYNQLPAILTDHFPLVLDSLPLEVLPTELTLYVGYRLGNEIFIYSGNNPLHFWVQEGVPSSQSEVEGLCLFCN